MKQEDLKAILENSEFDVATKISKIQALSGADVQAQKDKGAVEKATLQANFDNEKKTWEDEKAKFKDYVSKEDHQKIVDELENFKTKEEKGRRAAFLKSNYDVKEGYEDLVADKIDWSKASYDETKKTYVGDEFINGVKAFKDKYNDLFTPTQSNEHHGPFGNYKSQDDSKLDLTEI